MTTSSSPPGLILPTTKSFALGAGNPRDSAILTQQQMNASQNNLNKAVGGRRRRGRGRGRGRSGKKHRGGANGVAVPQFQMLYSPQGGPGTNPNDQIKQTSETSMQSYAWSKNDNLATSLKGGRRKTKRTKKRNRNHYHTRRTSFTKHRRQSKRT